jgi:peptidyl-prolyl cis-trans isomerase A (cyclophilin A)
VTVSTRRTFAALLAAAVGGASTLAHAQAAPRVKFVTSAGEFTVEVYPDKAPKTAANFLQYVKDKHYDGTIFHRVIPDFMVQGGGFDAAYKEKRTRAPVPHEGKEAMAKGLRNTTGMLAMARTNDPNSASSQFFINVKDNGFLDPGVREPYGYTVFGKVVSGMDVVEKIRRVPTGSGGPFGSDVPRTPITVTSATVVQ